MSSTPLPDHYKVLGVNKDAQVAEIRLAYRKLVLKCHPDKVQDPALKAQKQEEFQKVQQAYELLTDEEERRKYDDQVKLAELKEQLRKTSVSTPRSNSKYAEYEIRTAEPPRASSYKPATNVPPPAKGYTYPRSFEDDVTFSSRVYQTGSSRATRRETTYVDGRSKRDSEREAREKERDRERRKKADKEEAARREKEAKEAKDARREKRAKEKQRDKDIKRESEDKKKHTKPSATTYVEDYSDEAAPAAKSDKKKSSSSSSKKYDEKRDRDRSSHRDDIPVVSPPAPPVRSFTEYATSKYVELPRTVPAAPEPSSSWEDTHAKLKDAKSYMEAARAKESVAPGGLKRSMTYGPRMAQPPAAPTPPPAPNQTSPFAAPHDDDVRRSAARPRRGSTESNRPGGDRYRKSSREPIPAEPVVMSASPNSRHAHPPMSGSPPHLSRTNTMPADASYPRAVPITRSQTYNFGDGTDPRGRNRTRFQSQIDEEDSDEVHDHRARDRRHHGGRREHSVDPVYTESRYPYERQTSYSRRPEPEPERYAHYSSGYDSRPAMPARDTSYSTSGGSGQFAKVKTSKNYGYDDVHYSAYHHQKPREEYTYA